MALATGSGLVYEREKLKRDAQLNGTDMIL